MRNKILTAACLVAFLGLAATFLRIYYVQRSAIATPIWDGERCYLFVSQKTRGYDDSLLRFLVRQALQFLYSGLGTSDHRWSLDVFEIGPEGVTWHRRFNDVDLGVLSMLDGSILAQIGETESRLYRWNGRGFDLIDGPQARRDLQLAHSAFGPGHYGGWSTVGDVLNKEEDRTEYPIQIGGESITLVVQSVGPYINKPAQLGLKRRSGAVETFWTLDERSHRVSRAEYKAIFSPGPPQLH